MYWETKEA